MTWDGSIQLSPEDVLAISDALVTVERRLMRYHGRRIQLDAEPFRADFASDFKRLLRAKRMLGRELTAEQRAVIVDALRGAHIAIALHDGNPILDAAPVVNMQFRNAGELVRAALKVLAANRAGSTPSPWR